VFSWHGCSSQHVENVCRDGPRALRFTDGGFFATGSYTALELDYARRYAMNFPPSASGEYAHPLLQSLQFLCTEPPCFHSYPVILYAVFMSSAYVVTLRDYPPDDPDRPQMVRRHQQFFVSFLNTIAVGVLKVLQPRPLAFYSSHASLQRALHSCQAIRPQASCYRQDAAAGCRLPGVLLCRHDSASLSTQR
jgi:hypothetical protein